MSDKVKAETSSKETNNKDKSDDNAAPSGHQILQQKPKEGLLIIKMYSPFKTLFEGDAKSISALNDTGEFDVLPGHHNFITMLRPCEASIQLPDGSFKKLPIARGLMHVRDDTIIVFLDV